jgi:hypothetical protein
VRGGKQIKASAIDLTPAHSGDNEFDKQTPGTSELGSCLTDATREGPLPACRS